jgi:hypothetical protein
LRTPGLIRVPRNLAMPWLVDPDSGQLRTIHSQHYEIFART